MSSATMSHRRQGTADQAQGDIGAIHAWLQGFRARQGWQMFLQGVSLGALALLAGASIIMVLDAWGVLSDAWRWMLALGVDGAAIYVAASFGVFKPWTRTPLATVATDVESECPEMREQLLSCVELSAVDEAARNFSGAFLSVLQQRVARSLRERSIGELLPWSTVRGPCVAALASWLAVLGLTCLPRLEMPSRLQRALIPFWDVERPARTHIEVIKPSRRAVSVPENQALEFEIQLSGSEAQQASIQWRLQDGDKREAFRSESMIRIGMDPIRFASTLTIGSQALEYRFVAGDGRTAWRTIRPTPRPRVATFKHRIRYPDYTGVGLTEFSSDRGAITSLAGAQIDVGIEPTMALARASATVERLDNGERETRPMTYSADRSAWSFPWESIADARYQLELAVRLPDSDEDIENTYRPMHELNVVADHAPLAVWVANDQTFWDAAPRGEQSWIIAPDAFVSMAARIADDLPHASMELQISVNRAPWTTVPVALQALLSEGEDPANAARIDAEEALPWTPLDGIDQPTRGRWAWDWDVMTSGASSGDTVLVRVAARDSLQQVTYSPVLEFSLAASGFDRHRHDALIARASLAPELIRWSSELHAVRERFSPRLQQMRNGGMAVEDRTRLATELVRSVNESMERSREIQRLARRIVRQMPRTLDQTETEYVVRLVSKLEREESAAIMAASQVIALEPGGSDLVLRGIQERVDAAIRALHAADDHATRLVDIYRQFLGLETLTALTKDLRYLKDHQMEQIQRSDKLSFAQLARSQKIAVQYLDAVQSLAQRMEPCVSAHLQNGLRAWYRFLDQSREDLQYATGQEPTAENLASLTGVVKRMAENLRYQSWAFQLDGGLMWNISDARRDLMQRGTGLHGAMLQAVETLERQQTELTDPRIDSEIAKRLQAAAMQLARDRVRSAEHEMADRRELHQQRAPLDPMFASDMGLASRAWESQFGQWATAPPGSDERKKLKENLIRIVQAYRVLEVAHDMQDVESTAVVLQRQERYEWQSLEGRMVHSRVWDSLLHRLETLHGWMKESGFPQGVADAYRGLQWNDLSQGVRRSMDPRRQGDLDQVVSAAVELEAWLATMRETKRDAQPTIDEARRFLAALAPSIAELARRSARETRALQEQSRTDNPAASGPLQQRLEDSQRSIQQLGDALIEYAMRQDILDPQQLEIAKDSDRARQWLDELAPPMQQATESLVRAQQSASDVQEVQEASKHAIQRQDAMVSALETIEQHFSLLEGQPTHASGESNTPLDQSRDRLRARDEAQRQPLASYDQADRLSAMAAAQPEALLRALEEELPRNPGMQQELSELSRQAAQDAVAQLADAAREEQRIARDLENADPDRRAAKELQSQRLRQLGDATDRLAVGWLEKSAQVVQRMNLPETRASLNQMAEALRSSARDARAADPQQLASDLDNKLQSLANQVEQAQKKLEELAPNIQSKIEQPVTKDDQQRQGQRTEMTSWQSLMRDDSVRRAKEHARESLQSAEQAKRLADQKNQESQQQWKERTRLMEEWKGHPERPWVADALDRNAVAASQASVEARNAQRAAEAAQNMAQEAAKKAQDIENAPRTNLDRPNPIATLADEQMAAANTELRGIQQALGTAAREAVRPPETKSNAAAASQSSARQERLANSVEQLVDQMARSGRHEQRLNHQAASQTLAQQSRAIDQVSSDQVADARRELAQAASRAAQTQSDHSRQSRDIANPSPATPPAADAAIQRAQQAGDALSKLAENLEQIVAPKSSIESESPGSSSPRSPMDASAMESAKTQARLLDSLDQQIHGRQPRDSQGSDSQGSDPQGNDPQGEVPQGGDSQGRPGQFGGGDRTESSMSDPKGRGSTGDQGSGREPQRDASGASGLRSALREAADRVTAQLNRERLAGIESAKSASATSSKRGSEARGGIPDDSGRTTKTPAGDSRLEAVPMAPGTEWGKLREQRAEDATQGRREALDPEYSDAIRAYFRALGEQRR